MEFSLVTGTYRTRKTFETGTPSGEEVLADGEHAMTVRNKEFSLAKLESAGSKCFLPIHAASPSEDRTREKTG